ncbi:MAG: DNA repair protein RecO C-terminal domain-containing protein [Muribaculaceae bacterium]|nr:DNA repair protein RecO C-terminal domain-containing protein [Muribaculaceae bacterium]
MYTHLDCIALRTVKVSDSKNLLSAWSRQLGRVTFSMPAGTGREARRRMALTAPMCVFEGECDVKPDREILSIRDLKAAPDSLALTSSMLKTFTAIFLAEVLDILLKRSEADARLSDFLFDSVRVFAKETDQKAIAAFHLIFLYQLTHYAGIGPQLEGWHRGSIFDIRDGRFRNSAPLHQDFLQGKECVALMALSRSSYATASMLPFNRTVRNRVLDYIMQYYTIHLASLASIKSLDILREI